MDFNTYWDKYGELHASMCRGDIKKFAREIWESAKGNTDIKRTLPPNGVLPLSKDELREFSELIGIEHVRWVRICSDNRIEIARSTCGGVTDVIGIKAVLWIAERFNIEKWERDSNAVG